MEPQKIAKQMIDFNKTTFDNSFSAMIMLQEQTEKMVNMSLEQATWLPENGKDVINEWLVTYKKGREDFKKTMDENFKKVEKFFTDYSKTKKTPSK